MGRVTARRPVVTFRAGEGTGAGEALAQRRSETLAVEEPLEIRIAGRPFSVTMRTPGEDMDLAAGFCVSEGLAYRLGDVRAMRYCAGADADGENTYNVLDLELDPELPPVPESLLRNVYTTSSCGVCGKASLEAVRTTSRHPVGDDPVALDPALLMALPERLRAAQRVFDRTGGLHAAGLFTAAGDLLVCREDVGRHNAVDKVVGHALREGWLPLRGRVLLVSGRASFELAQKAVMAGIPVLAAVSAPSSLAVDLAGETGLTLVGFLRDQRMNVYTRPDRLVPISSTASPRATSSPITG